MSAAANLPGSWCEVELGECIDVHYGKALAARERVESGHVPVVGSSGVVGRHNAELVVGPSIVIGRKGAAGSVHIVCESSWPIDTAYYVQPPEGLSISWLHYYLGTCELGELDRSTAIPSLSRDDLYRVKVPIAPTAEQVRVVAKIDELLSDLDAGVAELKAAQKKLQQYRQSLLKAAVEGALTADWREAQRQQGAPTETGAQLLARILTERRARWEARQLAKFKEQGKAPPKDWQKKYPEPMQPDTSDLPVLPEGWMWATLDQLAEFVTSGSRGWAEYYSKSGATFIRSQNINRDWLDLSDIAYVRPPQSAEGARTLVQHRDLLLTITGANVGKTALVDHELAEAYVSQHVALIRLTNPSLSSYLHRFLTADAGGRGALNKEAYGAGKPGLNLQQVGAVAIPLPGLSEVEETMRGLITQFSALSALEESVIDHLKNMSTQRQNIVRAAFAGQLVPQDQNDEPAIDLMERIRAARNAAAGTRKNPRATRSVARAMKRERPQHVTSSLK